MFRAKLDIIFNNLPNMFKNMKVEADKVSERTADRCSLMAKAYCPVDTGALRDSIHIEKDEEVGWAVVAGDTEINYALYQEYGTVHQPGTPFLTPASERIRSPFLIDMSGVPERAANG